MLTQDVLNELFSYDPLTGLLVRRNPVTNRIGNNKGKALTYPKVNISGKPHSVHRIAWLMTYGHIPSGFVLDHCNGDRTDNRLSNLRLATQAQNQQNIGMNIRNTSGFKGVRTETFGTYRAKIAGETIGSYPTAIDAARAYDAEALSRFGAFARTNKQMGLYE